MRTCAFDVLDHVLLNADFLAAAKVHGLTTIDLLYAGNIFLQAATVGRFEKPRVLRVTHLISKSHPEPR